MFIIIMAAVMGLTLVSFFIYHLTLVRSGYTTNEKIKRSDFLAYIQRETSQLMHDIKVEQNP